MVAANYRSESEKMKKSLKSANMFPIHNDLNKKGPKNSSN